MLANIPLRDEAPVGAERTGALAGFTSPPTRRVVLRAMTLGALTVGAVVADWSSRFTTGAKAETGPGGLTGWDRNDCKDAYPNGYAEVRDNVGSYINSAAACFGGDYRGSTYCSSGWHRKGTVRDAPAVYTYTPISTLCGASTKKNAWRWTAGGTWWRCSDGRMTVSAGGSSHTYTTICRY